MRRSAWASTGSDGRRSWWLALAVVWVVAALYQWHVLDHGWLPHDDGTLAQSAERVLHGELPHRDFDEVWTGALTFLNAAALRLFGDRLISLRLPLYGVFLLWLPALYYVATRFARPVIAGSITALGAAWSLPQYSAAVPSWYNLFFATFATAALLRGLETGRRRWLLVTGIVLGLSLITKIAAMFCVAAVLLFLVYRETALTTSATVVDRPSARRWRAYPVVIGIGLGMFVASLLWLVHRRFAVGEVLHFVLPGAVLAFVVLRETVATAGGTDRARFGSLARLVIPFAVGLVIPIAIFLIPYVRAGSTAALWSDVFVVPMRRLDLAGRSLPGAATNLAAIPVALLVGMLPLPSSFPPMARRVALWVLMVALIAFLILSRHPVYYAIRPLLPLTVFVGAWLLARRRETLSPLRRQQLLLLLGMSAMWSLVQYPFAWPPYFFYVAPLAAMAVLAVLESQQRRAGPVAAAVLGLFFLAAFVDTHPSRHRQVPLGLERGGLVVGEPDAIRYDSLVGLLRAHASGGYTYAGPDCPEVYYLAGLDNPTRTLWEFLSDSAGRTARVLEALERHHVTVVAINRLPPFSGPLSGDLLDSLAARYPVADSLDLFTVRWRP